MITAIGYVRRSTDKQDESLDQQRTKLHAFAKDRGWILSKVYSDDAISGSDMKRAGLEAMLADACQCDEVEIVLTWDRNRLARPKDPVDGMLIERRLIEAGKRLIYAGTGQEADRTFAGGLLSYVEHHQNGDYLRKLSRDTMRGLVARAKRGRWPGGPIPFGFDRLILDSETPKRIVRDLEDGSQTIIDPSSGEVVEQVPRDRTHKKQDHETCTLIPSDPARVRAIQKMFADYASGKPTRQLREDLNAAGFRTSRGSRFSIATIHPMLDNPAYLGQCVYNRRTLSKWHRYLDGSSVERQDEGVEKRDESEWIVTEDAWPALVDAETFARVKARRQDSRERHRHTTGSAVRSPYLLSGLIFCGVCGGRLSGQTITSGKGYRTAYYVCSTHHNGHHDRCPTRYTVPAAVVEDHIVGLIRDDLDKLRDDDELHTYVANEIRRLTGGQSDAHDQLQRRLAILDQQTATLRDHLVAIDPATAESLGLYGQAKRIAEEKRDLESELAKVKGTMPTLPNVAELRRRACAAFNDLESVLAGGTIEEKRELVALYVQTIKAEPDRHSVQISLYPALFSRVIAGVGFEPTTSGL